jgi:hypothetical protein
MRLTFFSDHDRRPTTDDRRPTTDDRRPTTDDRRPTTVAVYFAFCDGHHRHPPLSHHNDDFIVA